MTLGDVIRNMFSTARDPEPDSELEALRQQKAIADRRYKNGVDALRFMNREACDVAQLRKATKVQLESAERLRRELKSEPG